ncbi:MAG: hypothetical protein MJ131_00440 [Lachnospiraceae bacterium]|nr:hypothetical protein [Lachnospiraceae bacterium]
MEKRRFNIVRKGEFGYISFMKKLNLVISLVLFLFAGGIFVSGLFLFESKANICTIIGALFVIPAARYMTVWILFMPHKSVSTEQFEKTYGLMKGGNILYCDVLITSPEKAYFLPFIAITGDKVIALMAGKDKLYKVQDYFGGFIRRRGFDDFKVTVTDDEAKFQSLLRAADSAAEIRFADDEEREAFDRERIELCGAIDSIMP